MRGRTAAAVSIFFESYTRFTSCSPIGYHISPMGGTSAFELSPLHRPSCERRVFFIQLQWNLSSKVTSPLRSPLHSANNRMLAPCNTVTCQLRSLLHNPMGDHISEVHCTCFIRFIFIKNFLLLLHHVIVASSLL